MVGRQLALIYIHSVKKVSLYMMVVVYFFAGINHFWHPSFYLKIMPPWLGAPETLVMISGMCEILFALLLLPIRTRRFAAWCIILLLIAVFPANIQMLINYLNENNPHVWLAILRLPIQLLLVAWAYSFARE